MDYHFCKLFRYDQKVGSQEYTVGPGWQFALCWAVLSKLVHIYLRIIEKIEKCV